MASRPMGAVLQYIHTLALTQAATSLADGQLLQRFTTQGDEAAFAALIQRHGRLVLRVCRNLLCHEQDAEDAFQATFLVLARKARALSAREKLAGWLHKTAYHCAMQIQRAAARRRLHERQASSMYRPPQTDEPVCQELRAIVDEEVARLADKYRAPFVLCCLEGKSKTEAARELGWKEGTVSGRLAHARKQLQQRLKRRGVTLSTALCVAALSPKTMGAVPVALVRSTAKAALLYAAGAGGSSGLITAEVAAVVRRVIKAMVLTKLKGTWAVWLTLGLIGSGAGVFGYRTLTIPQLKSGAEEHNIGFLTASGVPTRKTDQEPVQEDRQVAGARANGIHAEREETDKMVEQVAVSNVTVRYEDKEIVDLPEPKQLEDQSGGREYLAAMYQHLRDIHAPFPHLASMYEHDHLVPGSSLEQQHQIASSNLVSVSLPGAGTPTMLPILVGQKVPDFVVRDLDGKRLTLYELQKKRMRDKRDVVLLTFWCSFCGSCRRVEHQLDRLARDYQGKATVVAIDASAGETAAKVRAFAKQKGLSLPIFLDPSGHAADVFGTEVTTTSVVIDRDGVLRYCGRFEDPRHRYAEEALAAVLAGKETPIKSTPHDG